MRAYYSSTVYILRHRDSIQKQDRAGRKNEDQVIKSPVEPMSEGDSTELFKMIQQDTDTLDQKNTGSIVMILPLLYYLTT